MIESGEMLKDLNHGIDYAIRKDKHFKLLPSCFWRHEDAG